LVSFTIFLLKKNSEAEESGSYFLEKAEDHCRKKGHSRIELAVSTTNDSAIRLYSRTGFKPERMYMAKEII